MFKIMIGTLYCGEADFELSKNSLEVQNFKNYEHIIFKNLPQNIAHYKLYRKFMNSEYKYLVKLDADMSFMNTDSLSTMIYYIEFYKKYRVTFMVYDAITDSLINGIHVYSKNVEWDLKKIKHESIYPDRLDNLQSVKMKKKYCLTLDFPIAYHCKYANELQFFKFTYTRFLKKGKHQLQESIKVHLNNVSDNTLSAMRGIVAAHKENDFDLKNLEKYYHKYRNESVNMDYIYSLINKMEIIE